MGIPEEVRRVPRPRNTVVVRSGAEGPRQYAVRERAGAVRGADGRSRPVNGRVIGHICGGRFIPLVEGISSAEPDMLSFGAAAFIRSCSDDILDSLYSAYSVSDAQKILVTAALRILKPRISGRRLAGEYRRTFLSRFFPGISLSENTVSAFFQRLGEDGPKRKAFYSSRIRAVSEKHHVVVDGTLKQDTSTVNDLSAFSRKARVKGCRDISVIYAYDLEAGIPVCAEVFPGNSIDAVSYRSFIRDNDIQKGILMADKGFPPSQIAQELEQRPGLHFITPIKRNDLRIRKHGMYSFQGVLKNLGRAVLFKKESLRGGRFLYAYRDAQLAFREEKAFSEKARANEDFDAEKFARRKESFGTIVFESDQDLDPETVYRCYEDRWQIELVFQRYKNDECLDQTGVQGDFSVIGSELVNFVATTLTCRMLRKAQDAGLLETDSWADLMDDLSSAWRKTDGPENPRSDDSAWVHTIPKVMKMLESLGLSEKAAPAADMSAVAKPGKRGRPKGSRNKKTAEQPAKPQDEAQPAKRCPGRPKGSLNKKTLERLRAEGK